MENSHKTKLAKPQHWSNNEADTPQHAEFEHATMTLVPGHRFTPACCGRARQWGRGAEPEIGR